MIYMHNIVLGDVLCMYSIRVFIYLAPTDGDIMVLYYAMQFLPFFLPH